MMSKLYDYKGLNVYSNGATELYHSEVHLPTEFSHKHGEDNLNVYIEKAIERLPEYIQALIDEDIFDQFIKHACMQDINATEIQLEITIDHDLGDAYIALGYKYKSAAFDDKQYMPIYITKIVI